MIKPCLVATLGAPAAEQYRLSGCEVSVVSLDHPYYAYAKGSDSEQCAAIVTRNATKLRRAIQEMRRSCQHVKKGL
jgi:hypothetical protein